MLTFSISTTLLSRGMQRVIICGKNMILEICVTIDSGVVASKLERFAETSQNTQLITTSPGR